MRVYSSAYRLVSVPCLAGEIMLFCGGGSFFVLLILRDPFFIPFRLRAAPDQLVVGQQKAVIDAEKELKALMANPDEEVSKRYACA